MTLPASVLLAFALAVASTAPAQTPAPSAPTASSTMPAADPLAGLIAAQKTQFQDALAQFNGNHFGEALSTLRALLPGIPETLPAHALLTKFAAEAALNTGERDAALHLLLPEEAADPNDWQAGALLARYYAETGKSADRDRELARLTELHASAPADTPFARLNQILLEEDKLPGNKGVVRIWFALVPYGRYRTYVFARVYDPGTLPGVPGGDERLRITLESSDFDQPIFAKAHPDLAAKGERRFSLDGYGEPAKRPDGSTSESHMTFAFFDGQPPYDVVRSRILDIAEGRQSPTSRTDPGSAQ